ncbi:MAG: 3-deoxy-D-manno-octulosonic acid transferase, partial [Rhodocyclaceae bacterium]|nr:3-deoxy-D-manno-octulosonic acid transferase [Rhodocyclaceae bacterium]
PYDLPSLQARFLRHYQPRIGILMETEVWPNLVATCHQRHIPLMLANGRLSQRSSRRYRRLGALARAAFGGFDVVAAQTSADAERFRALGTREVEITGNIKFDIAPDATAMALGKQWRAALGGRKVVLAASTREGEEALMLAAAGPLLADGALLVIVPRHPQRFDAVAAQIAAAGLTMSRR